MPDKYSYGSIPSSSHSQRSSRQSSESRYEGHTPLPRKQLLVLAIIALAEQTALNSFSPYLPLMTSSFPGVREDQVGLYVGLIASSFALAQFTTNFFWGWLSDRIGRKPVVLFGTVSTAICFVAFGYTKTLGQAVAVQALMGLVNGNQGIISTCLGEITDRSNQSRVFTYLPVIYSLGSITGPLAGGLLVKSSSFAVMTDDLTYPFLTPNLFSAAILGGDLIITMIFLEESLEQAQHMAPLSRRVGNIFSRSWQFISSTRPSYVEHPQSDGDSIASVNSLLPPLKNTVQTAYLYKRDTIYLLLTWTLFQLGNIGFNSLYPIFASTAEPTGRDISPRDIGLSLAYAGAVTIIFQLGAFERLRDQVGNKQIYRISLAGFAVAFVLMPFVNHRSSEPLFGVGSALIWLWSEVGFILLIKTIATVGGLSSALLLITNSSPNHASLGTLNGLAQSLSAAGRTVGPFMSGALFTAATHVHPRGEALAWGIFGGIAFVAFLLSFGIRAEELESNTPGNEAVTEASSDA